MGRLNNEHILYNRILYKSMRLLPIVAADDCSTGFYITLEMLEREIVQSFTEVKSQKLYQIYLLLSVIRNWVYRRQMGGGGEMMPCLIKFWIG